MEKKPAGGLYTPDESVSVFGRHVRRSGGAKVSYTQTELLDFVNGSKCKIEYLTSFSIFSCAESDVPCLAPSVEKQLQEFWRDMVLPEFCQGQVGFLYFEGSTFRSVGVEDADSLYEVLLNTLARDRHFSEKRVVILRLDDQIPFILSIPKEYAVVEPRAKSQVLSLFDLSLCTINLMWEQSTCGDSYRPFILECSEVLGSFYRTCPGSGSGIILSPLINMGGADSPVRNAFIEELVSSRAHNVCFSSRPYVHPIAYRYAFTRSRVSRSSVVNFKADYISFLDYQHRSKLFCNPFIRQVVNLPIVNEGILQHFLELISDNLRTDNLTVLDKFFSSSVWSYYIRLLQGLRAVGLFSKLGDDSDFTYCVYPIDNFSHYKCVERGYDELRHFFSFLEELCDEESDMCWSSHLADLAGDDDFHPYNIFKPTFKWIRETYPFV